MKNWKLITAASVLAVTCAGMAANAAEKPTPANENGIITAEEWAEVFPEIVDSYNANSDNDYRVDYLEEDPYLTNIYEGFGFAKDYTSAIGHSYTLEDVANTERPHPLANCLTCKTADFTKLVNDMGVETYKYDFDETFAKMNESVGCYSCHANEADNDGELVVTHDYLTKTMGDNISEIAPETLACGQCHIEYYFDPETKETLNPYDSVEAMSPDAILAYYDDMGFSDWTQESTGIGLLKAQHPEMETFMGEVMAREKEVGENLSTLKTTLEEAVAGGDYTVYGVPGQTSVNNPLSLFGMKLYQNSTGWAATLKVSKEGEVIQETQICAGEYAPLEEYPEVVVMLSAFYPDYVRAQDGTPMTASSTLKNPGYLYMLYYKGEMLDLSWR